MRPDHAVLAHAALPARQRGFGLVAALFLILVVAAAIAAMARLATTQTATVSLGLQQARAYQAARAGLEWGVRRFLSGEDCNASFSLPEAGGFLVVVSCPAAQGSTHDLPEEGDARVRIQRISATASYAAQGNPDHVWRRVEAVVERTE